MDKKEIQRSKMLDEPIPKLITRLAIPTIISMLTTALYNMADTYFVSQLGTSASGAVGIVFSLMAIIQAIGFMIGMGAGSQISRLLGEKRHELADRLASSSFMLAIIFGTLLGGSGVCYIEPLMRLLGATETILPYAVDYAFYILLGAPVMMASFVMNNILRAEGKAQYAMRGIMAGGIINVGLNPLFIFTFDMGIGGSALATMLGMCLSFCLLSYYFMTGKSLMKLRMSKVSFDIKLYGGILKYGMASLSRQGLASVSNILLNFQAAIYGDAAIAAMSIVTKVFTMLYFFGIGFGQGYQPVVGYCYGAGAYTRVRQAFYFMIKVATLMLTVVGAISFIAAPQIMQAFISDMAVILIGTEALRAQCVALPFIPLAVACNMTYQNIGRPWIATLLSTLRQGTFFIPALIILPHFMGLRGVEYSQALADIVTFVFCVPFAAGFLRMLNGLEAQQKNKNT